MPFPGLYYRALNSTAQLAQNQISPVTQPMLVRLWLTPKSFLGASPEQEEYQQNRDWHAEQPQHNPANLPFLRR